MARISKGKFRYLRDLFGYNDFVVWENHKTGLLTGYHRGKVYTNMYPLGPTSTIKLPLVPGHEQTVTINYQIEV